jgi:hypothetical protein
MSNDVKHCVVFTFPLLDTALRLACEESNLTHWKMKVQVEDER